jgi:hypothetical protein
MVLDEKKFVKSQEKPIEVGHEKLRFLRHVLPR